MPKDHLAEAKVTVRGQVAVPRKVRDALGGLEAGDYLIFYKEGGRIHIEKGEVVPARRRA